MSAPTCIRCNRPLTNPASILAGIGPVCAARRAIEDRGVAGVVRSKFRLVRVDEDIVWIEDIGTDCCSVTNDAEAVVAALSAEYGDRRIIYRDSMGAWDELQHRGPVFGGFKAARDMSPEAVPTYAMRSAGVLS